THPPARLPSPTHPPVPRTEPLRRDVHHFDLDPASPALDRIRRQADEVGIHRVHALAWRELGDPEAGGSELHAHEVFRRWAAAGLDVTIRTSAAANEPAQVERDGYRAIRRAGRYGVFPRAAFSAATGQMGPRDGLVEIW